MASEAWEKNKGRFARLSPEERRAIAKKGGEASARKNAERKRLRDLADAMLSHALTGDAADIVRERFPDLDDDDITYAAYAVLGQILAAAGEQQASASSFEQLVSLQEQQAPISGERDALSEALIEAARKL